MRGLRSLKDTLAVILTSFIPPSAHERAMGLATPCRSSSSANPFSNSVTLEAESIRQEILFTLSPTMRSTGRTLKKVVLRESLV